MRIHNGSKLFKKLEAKGYVDKPLRLISLRELEDIVDYISDYVFGNDMPSYHGKGELYIPFSAPRKFKYWTEENKDITEKQKYELFLEMGVPAEDMHYFMHERAIDIALGKTDEMGREICK